MNTAPAEQATRALQPGAMAPDFTLLATPDQRLMLSDLRGCPVILAFYPADWSPVCGDQMVLLNEVLPEFHRYQAELLGISVDSAWCHSAFRESRNLHFPAVGLPSQRRSCAVLWRVPRASGNFGKGALRDRPKRRDQMEQRLPRRCEPWSRRHTRRARIHA